MISTYTPKTQRILGRVLALVLLLALTLRLDGQPGTQAAAKAGGLSVQAEHVSQASIGTAFSYQGRLDDGSNPANGMYDFQFRLYDSLTGTDQVGSPFIQEGVEVIDGLVSVQLDFGPVFDGTALYLEIAVKPTGGGGVYDILDPRQPLSPVPYALHAASIADGAVTGSKIGEPCGEGQVLARMGGAWSCADAELDLAPQQQISHTVQIGPFTYSPEEIQADLLTLGAATAVLTNTRGPGGFRLICLQPCYYLDYWHDDCYYGGLGPYGDTITVTVQSGSSGIQRWVLTGCWPYWLSTALSPDGQDLYPVFSMTCGRVDNLVLP
jgi:hypothetical protein